MSFNDCKNPQTDEIEDYSCASYYMLLDVLEKLEQLNNKINTTSPAASILLSEYYGNQDLDSNGLVYGYDFYISSTDIPQLLRNVPKRGLGMTWTEYQASIS